MRHDHAIVQGTIDCDARTAVPRPGHGVRGERRATGAFPGRRSSREYLGQGDEQGACFVTSDPIFPSLFLKYPHVTSAKQRVSPVRPVGGPRVEIPASRAPSRTHAPEIPAKCGVGCASAHRPVARGPCAKGAGDAGETPHPRLSVASSARRSGRPAAWRWRGACRLDRRDCHRQWPPGLTCATRNPRLSARAAADPPWWRGFKSPRLTAPPSARSATDLRQSRFAPDSARPASP